MLDRLNHCRWQSSGHWTYLFAAVCCAASLGARADYGFKPISSDFKAKASSEIVLKNMPRLQSQGSVGICYAIVASTLINEANCVRSEVADCASVPEDDLASPLDITRFNTQLADEVIGVSRFDYEGLNIAGGSQSWTLFQAMEAGSITKESCAPMAQVTSRQEDFAAAQAEELAMWKSFQDAYETYGKKLQTCAECALQYASAEGARLKKKHGLKAPDKDVMSAFQQDSYARFLDKLLIPDECWDFHNTVNLRGSWELKGFPLEADEKSYESFILTIKDVLGKQRPLSLAVCAQSPLVATSAAQCSEMESDGRGGGHAVVIKGYRRVCNERNVCRDALQVHNSWGEAWQKANSDGWVDARELIERTFYENIVMSWLEPMDRKIRQRLGYSAELR